MRSLRLVIFMLLSFSQFAAANVSGALDNLDFVYREGLAVRAVAKEICSCMVIQQLNVEQCKAQMILPQAVLKTFTIEKNEDENGTLFIRARHRGFVNAVGLELRDEGTGLAHGNRKQKRFGCRVHPSSSDAATSPQN